MGTSFDPPFTECESVQRVRATSRKLAGSLLPMSVLGELGTGRATLGREITERRIAASHALPCPPVSGAIGVGQEFLEGMRNASRKTPMCPVVEGVELLDERAQALLASFIRGGTLVPVFVGTPAGENAELPRGMGTDLAVLLGVSVSLPPLRERGDDAVSWARFLLTRIAAELGLPVFSLSPTAVAAIRLHPWFGNLHEMNTRVRKAVHLSADSTISDADLGLGHEGDHAILLLNDAVENFKRDYVAKALERCDGNRTHAAKVLGVDARTIFRYLERLKG